MNAAIIYAFPMTRLLPGKSLAAQIRVCFSLHPRWKLSRTVNGGVTAMNEVMLIDLSTYHFVAACRVSLGVSAS